MGEGTRGWAEGALLGAGGAGKGPLSPFFGVGDKKNKKGGGERGIFERIFGTRSFFNFKKKGSHHLLNGGKIFFWGRAPPVEKNFIFFLL